MKDKVLVIPKLATLASGTDPLCPFHTLHAPYNTGIPWLPMLNLSKACPSLFEMASLNMVLGCTLSGLANQASNVHRLAPPVRHVLGQIGRPCHAALYVA